MSGTRPRSKGQAQARNSGKQANPGKQGQAAGRARGSKPGTTQANARSAGGAARGPRPVPPVAARPASNGGRAATEDAAVPTGARAGAQKHPAAIGGPPRWLRLTTMILSVAGLGASIYLTITHYSTSVSLACPDTGTINCEKVTSSPESVVFGIPVAVLGLAFFVLMVAVNNPLAWRSPLRAVHLARLLSVIVGIGFVLYLIYVELFKVNAICLWCTSVHVITFALFVLILLSAALWGLSQDAHRDR